MRGKDTVRGVSARRMSSVYLWALRWMISGSSAVLLFIPGSIPVSAASTVIINEIMWDGAEYIEFYNNSDTDVSLNGWKLTRQQPSGEPKNIITFSTDDNIAPQAYFLIEKTTESTLQEAQEIVAGLTLVNTGELVLLHDAEGMIIDSANHLGPWFAGENTASGSSMERTDPTLPGDDVANWHTAIGEHSGREGSPGEANSVPTPNMTPVALIAGSSEGKVGMVLDFSAEDSEDGDEDDLTYTWLLGDGASASGMEVSHTYTKAGLYIVALTVADGEATDEVTRTVTISAPTYTDEVVVNEVLPNPTGTDTAGEFIELFNSGTASVDVSMWRLDDGEGGSAPYTLPAGSSIAAKSYAVYFRAQTKLALNNDSDTARLLDPTNNVRSQLSYEDSAPEGQSYNRTSSNAFVISTTVTPGALNVITSVSEDEEGEEEEESASIAATGRIAGTSAVALPLANIREKEVGTVVQTEGVVSVPPGVLNARWFYLAGSGAQVYLYSAAFPELRLGDKVRLTGELSSYQNETRLKVSQAADIQKLQSGAPPLPHRMETGEIGEDSEGSLVVLQGEVTETSGDTFYIDDGSGEVRVFISALSKIDKPKMKKGMAVTITGIVSETRSGYRVLPRFQEDIRMGLVAGLTTFPATGYAWLLFLGCGVLVVSLVWQACRNHEPLIFI